MNLVANIYQKNIGYGINMTICFHCDKEIIEKLPENATTEERHAARYQMYPVEIPYINLFFHRYCFPGMDKIDSYLQEQVEKILAAKGISDADISQKGKNKWKKK